MRTCNKCKEEKPLTEFSKHKRKKDGINTWCKACDTEYHKKHYAENKEKYAKKAEEWKTKNREKVRENQKRWYEDNSDRIKKRNQRNAEINRKKITEIHGTKCVHCGATESIGKRKSLQLHHPEPNGKDFDVGNRLQGNWKSIEAEVQKCILLCHHCHRAEHVRMRQEICQSES